jgi:glycine dehydrogenase subunit 2
MAEETEVKNMRIQKPGLRRFHQARWDEPIIFELSVPGQRGVLVPELEDGIRETAGNVLDDLPQKMRRNNPPHLPELSQPQVLRHYIRLSQENLGNTARRSTTSWPGPRR